MERLKWGRRLSSYFPRCQEVIKFLEDDLKMRRKRIFVRCPYQEEAAVIKNGFKKEEHTSLRELATL